MVLILTLVSVILYTLDMVLGRILEFEVFSDHYSTVSLGMTELAEYSF